MLGISIGKCADAPPLGLHMHDRPSGGNEEKDKEKSDQMTTQHTEASLACYPQPVKAVSLPRILLFKKKMYLFSQHNVMNDWKPKGVEGVKGETFHSSRRHRD